MDGVWAAAPYLHNGSVPTLRDMLVPQGQRPTSFCVGSRAFDPVNVGLLTKSTVGRQLCGRPDELRCVAAWEQQSRTFLRGQGNRLKEAAALA
ncbi:hypothetical protein [Bradyrhizobium yuanmingense]|uniref:c-type cytochrome n=1 Tax=Bradyrhizobium yuanmingense TaxID=108015 RepID=UPI003517725C